jgi:hypothetical protein
LSNSNEKTIAIKYPANALQQNNSGKMQKGLGIKKIKQGKVPFLIKMFANCGNQLPL